MKYHNQRRRYEEELMEELGSTNSLKQARRLMEEIAISGRWTAVRAGSHSVIYSKGNDEMTVLKKDARSWAIVKYLKGEEIHAAKRA